ncbi:MAG TPA: NAD(P)-binding domain-containing protein [Blastocatellia bacterium]|nr:NAD(P)-binding domain-containing protein [Blastocatellia bacterium]
MAGKNRFIIRRKDRDNAVDDVVLESDGLTIGRLISNDVVLNHRAVSRTHAGVKELNGEFWLFNFSESNGTSLNGQLVGNTPLADGDVIQIGPYLLLVNYLKQALAITVERQLEVQTVDGAISLPVAPAGEEQTGATVMIKMPALPGSRTVTPGGTKRLQGTGLLSGGLGAQELALEIFWKNRKREAGKIAEKTPLHPRSGLKVGKSQFNWRPSLDLRRLWRKSYFGWGAVAVVLSSFAALLAYESAYSPGELSTAHSSTAALSPRGIANRPNEASCSNCHGVTEGMQDKCISCHATTTFRPTIYTAHDLEGMACTNCHTEHQGPNVKAGLVSFGLCSTCHNGVYKVKVDKRGQPNVGMAAFLPAGSPLPIPHGGTVGYPKKNGEWTWRLTPADVKRKGLPDSFAKYEPKEQFHGIHYRAKVEKCGDCHSGAKGDPQWLASPKGECAKCHGVAEATAGGMVQQANCNTCHQQHGESEDLARFGARAKANSAELKTYIASLDQRDEPSDQGRSATAATFDLKPKVIGGVESLRHDGYGLTWRDAGGVPWYGWAALIGSLPIAAVAVMAFGTARRRRALKAASSEVRPLVVPPTTGSIDLEKAKAEGPDYPHPVIDPVLCIGCHACVEACPHDVLAIVNGIASPIALDQCMEDTSCQVECPTNPKACIVINTNKIIPPRKVPARNQRLQTNVDGIYMIGDVSGVPLIKNAINEGGLVVDNVIEEFRSEGANPNADYDVAIVGIGPAGLSAAVIAKQRGLRYVAIEQDRVVSTIDGYPAGKYVFFKPDTVEARGGIPLPGPGEQKESILQSWSDTMKASGVHVNEEESCTGIKRDDNIFEVITERGKTMQRFSYKTRKVILAIGNRGTPMTLKVPGEELRHKSSGEPVIARHCPRCGAARQNHAHVCVSCGTELPAKTSPEDPRVKYKLSDPAEFAGKRCIVVGAGNSAIEAAVDLCGFKREGDQMRFTRDNDVTLVVRSDFKGDLKLDNKMNVYDCIDAGKIKVFFRTEIKEITESEVVLKDVGKKEEKTRIPNDYVFALIGGEKPTKFLEGLGIKIG